MASKGDGGLGVGSFFLLIRQYFLDDDGDFFIPQI